MRRNGIFARRPVRLAAAALPLLVSALAVAAAPRACRAQEAEDPVRELITALRELRDEVRELKREVGDLRRDLEDLRRAAGAGGAGEPGAPPAAAGAQGGATPPGSPEPRAISLPATAVPYIVDAPADGSVLRGRIVFHGTSGEPRLVAVTRDADAFGPTVPVEDLLVAGNDGVENAVVWLDGVRRGKPFSYPAPVVEARGPRFIPRVQVASPGAVLKLVNGNPVGHVFRAPGLFNLSLPPQAEVSRGLPGPGLVRVADDLHPWITAYVFVAPTPYAVVTGTDGGFELAQIPPGKHRLRVWHESLGEATREIEARTGGLVELEVPLGLGQ